MNARVCGPVLGRHVAQAAIVGLMLLLPACGRSDRKPVYPVEGQVRIGGQPLKSGFVVLHPLNRADLGPIRPSGRITDGSFTLTTYEAQDGAPAGQYAVTVESRQPSAREQESDRPASNALPDRYSRAESSKLQVTIAEGPNQLPVLQLTK